MKKHWKPILTLLVLSSVLTELLSTNLSPSQFFQPAVLLLLMTVGYGFPILVIREIAIRKQLGLLGLFFLGVMYGLYNEALVARTIFNPFHAPIDTFATYGLVDNIRIPWALTITFWHALYAVIYPILSVGYLFPHSATESWIGKKLAWVLGAGSLLFGVVTFFGGSLQSPREEISHFVFIVISLALLWWCAQKFAPSAKVSQGTSILFSWKNPGLGLILYVALFFLPMMFSVFNIWPVFYIAYFALITGVGMRKLLRVQEVPLRKMVLIGLGGEIALALMAVFVNLPLGLIFLAIFIAAIFGVKRKPEFSVKE